MGIFRHRKRIEDPGHARYLTFSCYQRFALFQNDEIKDAFVNQLRRVKRQHRFRLFAWVIMPTHVHLLFLPRLPDAPVPTILRSLKQPFAQRVLQRWRELDAPIMCRIVDSRGMPHFWQRGGGYDRNIVTDNELFEKVAYIHNNPVRSELAERPVHWTWSSARWYEGDRSGPIEIDPIM